jgi:hypothetical protein
LKTTLRSVVFVFADPEMKTAVKVNIVACEAAAPHLAVNAHFPNTVKAAEMTGASVIGDGDNRQHRRDR